MTDRSLSSGQPCQADPNGHGGDAAIWETVGRARRWLDDANGSAQPELTMRILKIAEEYGEAATAWVGAIGQNPRKGVTHALHDVVDELGDVAFTALVAVASLGFDAKEVLAGVAAKVDSRFTAPADADQPLRW